MRRSSRLLYVQHGLQWFLQYYDHTRELFDALNQSIEAATLLGKSDQFRLQLLALNLSVCDTIHMEMRRTYGILSAAEPFCNIARLRHQPVGAVFLFGTRQTRRGAVQAVTTNEYADRLAHILEWLPPEHLETLEAFCRDRL